MAKSQSFRFAIADSKLRSECWSFFTNKNDVYLTTSTHKGVAKVSLHESGVCQFALLENFFTEHIEWRENAPEFRSILRWKRFPVPTVGGQVAASIVFASYKFWPEQDAILSQKKYTSLAPPPDMYACMVNIAYSREDPERIAKAGEWADELLFSTRLPNGEFVCLIQEERPLPEGTFDYAPMNALYGVSLGLSESEMSDARGISILDSAHVLQGHGFIRSFHNMRLISVPTDAG